MKYILYFIVFLFSVNIGVAQTGSLTLNLEQGKVYKHHSTSNAIVVQTYSGENLTIEMTIKGSMSFSVVTVNENDYDMEVRFDELSLLMKTPQGKTFSSSKKGGSKDVMSMIMNKMTNKPFYLKMTKTGKVLEVKGVEKLWEDAINQFTDLPNAQREQIKAQINKSYGADALKGNIEMVTAIFPDKAVNVGEEWVTETKLESGMAAKIRTTYRYAEAKPKYIVITGTANIATENKDAYVKIGGKGIKYDLKGVVGSKIKIDRKSGWITEASIDQMMSGNAFIKQGESDLATEVKVPMEFMTITLIKN